MEIELKELIEAIEKAWSRGYARGILSHHKEEERDVRHVLTETLSWLRAKEQSRP
jgi:hypothetical protein